jgi:hypothetical protein
MAQAIWNGHVIAESDDTIVVEGNHYFPPDSVDAAVLQDSDTTSRCVWKGQARYKDIVVDGAVNADAAWYYSEPGGRPDRRLLRVLAGREDRGVRTDVSARSGGRRPRRPPRRAARPAARHPRRGAGCR